MVAVLALRELRPRNSGRQRHHANAATFQDNVAPLYAALVFATRKPPPLLLALRGHRMFEIALACLRMNTLKLELQPMFTKPLPSLRPPARRDFRSDDSRNLRFAPASTRAIPRVLPSAPARRPHKGQ